MRAICGEVSVVVPHGVALDMTGYAMFGEQHTHAGAERIPAGAPVVHVRARTAFGKLTVKRGWGWGLAPHAGPGPASQGERRFWRVRSRCSLLSARQRLPCSALARASCRVSR